VALMQEDMKKLIAYSSVAHMGFVTMGLFAFNRRASRALFQMLSHGLVSGALFLCVGVIYDRMHTREIAAYGGLVKHAAYALVFMLFTMACRPAGHQRLRRRIPDMQEAPNDRRPDAHLARTDPDDRRAHHPDARHLPR
jgi:hypothetical protein